MGTTGWWVLSYKQQAKHHIKKQSGECTMLSSYLDAIFSDDKDFTLLISPCTCKSPQALSRVLLSASQCFLRSKRSGTLHVPKKLIPPASVMQNIMFGQKKKKKADRCIVNLILWLGSGDRKQTQDSQITSAFNSLGELFWRGWVFKLPTAANCLTCSI